MNKIFLMSMGCLLCFFMDGQPPLQCVEYSSMKVDLAKDNSYQALLRELRSIEESGYVHYNDRVIEWPDTVPVYEWLEVTREICQYRYNYLIMIGDSSIPSDMRWYKCGEDSMLMLDTASILRTTGANLGKDISWEQCNTRLLKREQYLDFDCYVYTTACDLESITQLAYFRCPTRMHSAITNEIHLFYDESITNTESMEGETLFCHGHLIGAMQRWGNRFFLLVPDEQNCLVRRKAMVPFLGDLDIDWNYENMNRELPRD